MKRFKIDKPLYIEQTRFKKRKQIFYNRIFPKLTQIMYHSRNIDYHLIANFVETEFTNVFKGQLEQEDVDRVFDSGMMKICKKMNRKRNSSDYGTFMNLGKNIKQETVKYFDEEFEQIPKTDLKNLEIPFIPELKGEIFKYVY